MSIIIIWSAYWTTRGHGREGEFFVCRFRSRLFTDPTELDVWSSLDLGGLESIGPFANICEAHMRISVTYASLNDPFSKVSSFRIPNLWSHGLEDRYMNMVESILYPAIKEPVLICNYS